MRRNISICQIILGLKRSNRNMWTVLFTHQYREEETLMPPVYLLLNFPNASWFSMFWAFWTTMLHHYQAVLFCCWALISEYIARLEPGVPHIPLTPPHYSVSVCLTLHIYPLTSSGRRLTCRSLNTVICQAASQLNTHPFPHIKANKKTHSTNPSYTTVTTSGVCHFRYWQEKNVDLSQKKLSSYLSCMPQMGALS